MAEAVFLHKVREMGLQNEISADSAGTGDWHVGEPPHAGTSGLLRKMGIDYDHRARQLTARDFEEFDLILTMDDDNFRAASRLAGGAKDKLRTFLSFAPHLGLNQVPDPWYTGNFAQTYELASEAAEGLIEHIQGGILSKIRRDSGIKEIR